jgi:hypothetical protein
VKVLHCGQKKFQNALSARGNLDPHALSHKSLSVLLKDSILAQQLIPLYFSFISSYKEAGLSGDDLAVFLQAIISDCEH